jgi:hypothetical protein
MDDVNSKLLLYYDWLKNSGKRKVETVELIDFPFGNLRDYVEFLSSKFSSLGEIIVIHDESVEIMERLGWVIKYNSEEFEFLNRINRGRIVTKSITSFYLLIKSFQSESILYAYMSVLHEMGYHSVDALEILSALENVDEAWCDILEGSPPSISLEELLKSLCVLDITDLDVYILLQDAFFPFLDNFYIEFVRSFSLRVAVDLE